MGFWISIVIRFIRFFDPQGNKFIVKVSELHRILAASLETENTCHLLGKNIPFHESMMDLI